MGGTEGMWPNPLPAAANSKSPSFPPWPQTKTDPTEGSLAEGWPEVAPVPFINSDLIACLVGCSNKAPVLIDGQETMALIDSSVQVSSVSSQFCEELAWDDPIPASVIGIRGDRGHNHPLPWLCGGQPLDPRDPTL